MHKVKLEEVATDQIRQIICSASSSKGFKSITLVVDILDDEMYYELTTNRITIEENGCLEWIIEKYNKIDI